MNYAMRNQLKSQDVFLPSLSGRGAGGEGYNPKRSATLEIR